MRLLVVFICLAAGWTLRGQESSLLWRVEREGELYGYVFGTMHLNVHAAVKDTSALFTYMDECAVFSPELDLTRIEEIQMELAGKMMYAQGLASLYSEQEWIKVDSLLEAQFGETKAFYYYLKPFWVSAMLAEDVMSEQNEEGGEEQQNRNVPELDIVLTYYAQRRGLKIEALETPLEQLNAVESIPLEEQAAELYRAASNSHVANGTMDTSAGTLIQCYASKDLNCIELIYASSPLSPLMEEFLITRRNDRMVDALRIKLNPKSPVFCAIGAMHLPGEDGVLNQLRLQGYSVSAVLY